MSWSPLTFSSRKLHLSYGLLLHPCRPLSIFATANLLCLNSISLFFSACNPFFLTQWPPDRLPKPPVSLSAGLEQAKKLKDPSPSQRRLLTRLRWKALASWQIMPCSAQAPPTNFNESRNASGKKLEKSPCIQVHATPGQPPWVGLAVAMSAFPWCEARSILAHRSHDVINPVWTPVKNRTMWLKRLGWVKNTSSLWLKEVPYS